ncbi:MAG TPA: response regulator [Caulobacteraceae bacterium]|nr:response regulator [Caulobacteraceae bacterium]
MQQVEMVQAQPRPRRRQSKPRILIVEDEAMIAMMLEDMLQDMGCEIAGSFGDLGTALRWVAGHEGDFDAALLDVNLGGETVFPVADVLYKKGKPFGFVTSYASIPQARGYDAQVLNKPVSQRDLESLVESFTH